MLDEHALPTAGWRKSSYSGGGGVGGGNCVEIATVIDGRIAIRDSKNPDAGVLFFTRAQVASWIKGLKRNAL
ncbi:DUF397 domain-containing protein [Saccharopolyspora sp. 5N708]|uniref:DUF397 domain-containing protein n=1 Tax=Saccharopolyspora sp. 5N708 TaxID=3457424 RepID=UPI003FD43046